MIKTPRFGLQRGKLATLLILMVLLAAFGPGCTIDEPGYVTTTSDSAVQVVNSRGDIITIDEGSGAIVEVDFAYHQLHEGNAFTTNYTDDTLADGETIIMVFKTMPSDEMQHIVIVFTTLVGGYIELWEDVEWTTDTGTLNPIVNRKRTTPRDSGVSEDKTATPAFTATNNVLVNPTGLNTGGATSLQMRYAWGEKGKIEGGTWRSENEFILEHSTQYAIVFTAIGAANKAEIILNWYEHR